METSLESELTESGQSKLNPVLRWRWCWFSLAVLLFAFCWPISNRLQLDRSLERMFAANDPVRLEFQSLREKFGVADLVVFAYRDSDFWNSDLAGLNRLRAIRERIESLDGVAIAMDLSKINQMIGQVQPSLFGSQPFPMLNKQNQLAAEFKTLFEGQTHSPSSDLIAIACLLKPALPGNVSQAETIDQLRSIALSLPEKHAVSAAMLVGQPVMVEEGFDEIERDGVRLGYYSTVSLTLLIILGFRSLRWALITICVVQWSLVVTRGLLAWLDWDLTMVSSMLSSIVTVIGVAAVMHWLLGYRQAMSRGGSAEQALNSSMRHLWKPIFWASITDAIGFASLTFADVGPVQDYGWMITIASLIVLVSIFVLVPTLALIPVYPTSLADRIGLSFNLFAVPGDQQLHRWLDGIMSRSLRYARAVAIGAILLALFACWGSARMRVDTDFVKNFRQDAPLVIAYQAVERELGGAGVWDVVLPVPSPMTSEYLDLVLQLEKKLLAIRVSGPDMEPLQLTKVLSIADTDLASRRSILLSKMSVEARLFAMRQAMGGFVNSLITNPENGLRYLRVMLRSREQAETIQKEQLIASVRSTVQESLQSAEWRALFNEPPKGFVSGYYVLLSALVSSVIQDQWRCFAIAALGIWLAMTIALRSPWLAAITMLPNALPSMCIMGFMGWTNMPINLGAAMISAVSMGLSVDSSLHYLMRFQKEIRDGKEFESAMRAAQSEIGTAMLLSSMALVLGFGSLAMSDFIPTVVFGSMSAISMLGGLVANLTILPALLALSWRKVQPA
jgi:predicted RND superfamily exporter protein